MPRKLDRILDQAAIPDTVTDAELDDLRQDIIRDVTAVLMFGERPTPARHHPVRLERADITLQALCRDLLRSDDASDHLARIADSPVDPEGALHFGCLLDLAKKSDGALWWWQFAAGAGNATAAYCLYLFHTRRGDLRDADHWWHQYLALGPRDDDFVPPPAWMHLNIDSSGVLRKAVERLKVDEAAGEFHHPDHRLADQIDELVDAC
ncbi:hypothetical protein ACFV2Z_40250 [Streptomyces sp. NPDC059688]|uniref:Uncharacterized protein n=1 Tax=Streptomyces albidocamelliae TaxID=2981135 RepID=A0ABY6F1J4_9ACTN|nr:MULTISPECIES: hypothetical protein [unclassified Streptomyces]ROP44228.1 hypothetical protein EDD94_8016 [Streptomyces sp. PanSC9]UXY40494.1 hypothetical protein N8I86_38690 [Streptomyces sp. HUAS 14-6]